MLWIRISAACMFVFVVARLFSAPIKSYSTADAEVHDNSAPLVGVDQALAVPLSGPWTLTAGGEYAAIADSSFFSDPFRIGGRIGATHTFPKGLYSETIFGVISWFGDSGIDATSYFVECAINGEGPSFYLAFRDRILFNSDSLVSVLTLHGKWYPVPYLRSEGKTSLALETGLGVSPAIRGELSFAPFSTLPYLFFGAGAGVENYAIPVSQGSGRGIEATALGHVSLLFDSGQSLRVSAERHFGDRNDDLWRYETYFVLILNP